MFLASQPLASIKDKKRRSELPPWHAISNRNRNSPLSFDLGKYCFYEDETRPKIPGALWLIGPTYIPTTAKSNSLLKSDEIHPNVSRESVPYLHTIMPPHNQRYNVAISNDPNMAEKFSSCTLHSEVARKRHCLGCLVRIDVEGGPYTTRAKMASTQQCRRQFKGDSVDVLDSIYARATDAVHLQ